MPKFSDDISIFHAYRDARRQFLHAIGCDTSCRDPLSEFSERLVCQLLNGTLATSRVQKGYDLITQDGNRVQVKYLANPSGRWRNEHTIVFAPETDRYALVFFEDFEVEAVLIFPRERLSEACFALKKRHPDQENKLQFTQVNYRSIVNNVADFEKLGVTCFFPGKLSNPRSA